MAVLNRQGLGAPSRAAEKTGGSAVRVLQIGDGNFLRAFADWMFDLANEAGVTNLRVTLAAARGPGVIPQLAAQDGLFTVISRGVLDGAAVDQRHVVRCVERGD
ncbi:MAG: hypothetical protein QM776_16165 [Rhodocyclaceae bacterium]